MKQYISAANDPEDVQAFLADAADYHKGGYYTETDLADIKLSAERRLKTLEGRQ